MAIPKLSGESLANFFNSRNAREKAMLIVLGICFVVTLDVLAIVQPLVHSFLETRPALKEMKQELKTLGADKKNASKIREEWEQARQQLEAMQGRFVASSEFAAENLSKLAQESGVKITMLTPAGKAKKDVPPGYAALPFKINALSGAHPLGRFLSKAESGPVFFRVDSLTIRENTTDVKNHQVEMTIECYRKI